LRGQALRSNIIVTVGICVRNCESTLGQAIESVMALDFPHELMEIIIVDDGSMDRTPQLIREYAKKIDMQLKIFDHKWKGLGYSRNIVVDNAKGRFILWVDGDMLLSRDYLTKLFDYMEKHPQVAIVKGKQALELGSNLLATLEGFSRAASRMVDYDSQKAKGKALGTGGAICRLEAIKQTGKFDEKLKGYGEDLDTEIRIRSAGWKLAAIDAEFLDYERCRLTWRNLMNRYQLRGYYTHYFLHKHEGFLKHYKMLPPVAFLTGLIQANLLFRLTHVRGVFLLPFQHMLKMTAWYIGFAESHLKGYQPS